MCGERCCVSGKTSVTMSRHTAGWMESPTVVSLCSLCFPLVNSSSANIITDHVSEMRKLCLLGLVQTCPAGSMWRQVWKGLSCINLFSVSTASHALLSCCSLYAKHHCLTSLTLDLTYLVLIWHQTHFHVTISFGEFSECMRVVTIN